MLRKDYILNRYTYISTKRAKRPHQYKETAETEHPEGCPFCAGQEAMTPPEIGRIAGPDGGWQIRWFKNKFPVLSLEKEGELTTDNDFFTSGPAVGTQEIIVETPDKRQMVEFSKQKLRQILKVYQKRIVTLSAKHKINYVLVFKNKGKKGGASIIHSHTQVMATAKIPTKIEAELSAFSSYKTCPYCEVLKKEKQGPRLAFENKHFVAFCPFAPRYNYEIWILPKQHKKTLGELSDEQYLALADLLKKVLAKLDALQAPYCFYVQYAPKGRDFHFQIEVLPRLNVHAGFELSGGDLVVTVSPEQAATFFRRR